MAVLPLLAVAKQPPYSRPIVFPPSTCVYTRNFGFPKFTSSPICFSEKRVYQIVDDIFMHWKSHVTYFLETQDTANSPPPRNPSHVDIWGLWSLFFELTCLNWAKHDTVQPDSQMLERTSWAAYLLLDKFRSAKPWYIDLWGELYPFLAIISFDKISSLWNLPPA